MEKIKATTNPVLIFDENRGIHIYKALFDLARQHGYGFEWDVSEDDEWFGPADYAMEWLNQNACEGCTIELYRAGVWAIPLGYSMTEGCSVSPFGDYV